MGESFGKAEQLFFTKLRCDLNLDGVAFVGAVLVGIDDDEE